MTLIDDLAALTRIAEAATPGPWRLSGSGYSVKTDHEESLAIICAIHGGAQATQRQMEQWIVDSDYIAAFSPDVVLRLLRRMQAAEAELADRRNYKP